MNILRWGVVCLLLLVGSPRPEVFAQEGPGSLQELLDQVRAERQADSKLHGERESRFLAERDQRQSLLQQAESELAGVKQQSEEKQVLFRQNEDNLVQLRSQLKERAASLGELFGVVRQISRDTAGMIEGSFVSVQSGDRADFLNTMAESTELASLEELERLWISLLEEMTQSGQVVKFSTAVTEADGAQSERAVVRVGTFNAVSEGQYLRYVPETRQLAELARQPEGRYISAAQELEQTPEGYSAFGVDPSRGAILAALVQRPNAWERIEQGGLIGFVILAIGLIAAVLIVERTAYLWREDQRMKAQRQMDELRTDNALGRVMLVYQYDTDQNVETLEARLEEAILEQLPILERGLATLGIFAAVAPLLGLLGTVVGMIDTFQSITLFGAGDPRVMSDGISQALVTTQLGLSVAIPIVLLHSLLSSKSARLIHTLEEQSAGMIALLAGRSSLLTEQPE